MRDFSERPSHVPWPPIVAVTAIAVGVVLGAVWPLGWPKGAAADILQGVGLILIFVALGIVYLALRAMRNAKTTVRPHAGASRLVTTGPFALSRNPLYLSTAIFIVGIGLATGNAWLLIGAILTAIADHHLAIKGEEAHLEHRFGKAWREYKKRVRRWI